MKTTVHESIREDLKAYADGELHLPRRLQLSRHVAGCPDCQKEMEEMKKITHYLFASEGASTLSDPLRSRLMGSIGDQIGDETRTPSPVWRRWTTWVYGGAGTIAAASALTFAVTYVSATRSEPSSGSTYNAAPVAAAPVAAAAAPASGAFAMKGMPAAKPTLSAESMKSPVRSAAHIALAQPPMFAESAGGAVAYQGASGRIGVGGIGHRVLEMQSQLDKTDNGQAATSSSDYQATPSAYVSRVRKVDNEANLGVEVDDVEAAGDKIGDMVKADGGYIATNNLTVEGGTRVDRMTLKIPSQDFDSMIAAFSRYGTVIAKNVTGEDITDKTVDANSDEQGQIDQVVETESKLRAERMSERRRAALEERLDDQRSALAQTRARLGALRKTAALSTVNLTLTEKAKAAPAPPKPTFWSGFGETNQAASAAFQSAVKVPVVAGIWLLALSPIWLPLALLVRYLTRNPSGSNRSDR